MSDTVLAHFDPHKPLKLSCNASPDGIGVMLLHVMSDGTERPIALVSHSLSTEEKNYAQIDRETLSLVWGVKWFNHYLHGNKFTLVTDHQLLVSIFNPQKGVSLTAAARMQRWVFFFFFWEDIDTRLNSKEHANMLTLMGCHVYHWMGVIQRQRKKSESTPVDFFFFTFTQLESCPVTEAMIRRETRRDPTLSYVYSAIQSCWNTEQRIQFTEFYQCHDKLSLDEGCIMWWLRVVVPPMLRTQVLEELHVGHLGVVTC